MRKILLFILGILITACVPHDETTQEVFYTQVVEPAPEPIETPVVSVTQTQPTPLKSTPAVRPNKTYMAGLAKKLKKTAGNSGISVLQQGYQIIITLPNDVAFGSNQSTLDSQIEPIIAQMARLFKEYDAVKIQVFGYTDNSGTVAANKAYSLRQANAVANFLRLNGIDINRIVVDGLGAENPIANNETEANRRRNRRVEITLINMQ